MTKYWRCRMRWHKYMWRESDGARYRVCRRCGEENYSDPGITGTMVVGF